MKALDSPLLNDNKINGAKNVLLLIVSGSQEITIDEIGEINDHIQIEAGHNANIIMGVGEDENLGDAIAVTVIALTPLFAAVAIAASAPSGHTNSPGTSAKQILDRWDRPETVTQHPSRQLKRVAEPMWQGQRPHRM